MSPSHKKLWVVLNIKLYDKENCKPTRVNNVYGGRQKPRKPNQRQKSKTKELKILKPF